MRHTAALALLGTALVAGCSDGTSPDTPRTVSLSFSSRASGAAASIAPGLSAAIVVGSGAEAITITRVQLVLREIELKTSQNDACASETGDDDCEELSIGPVLVDLPLDGSVTSPISVAIPEGTYREVELELHKPDDGNARDQAFARRSVRIEGTHAGAPFVLTSEVDAELELEFEPPLVVGADGGNVTINVDVARWFRTATGAVLAPTTANLSAIGGNVVASFKAYDDHDRDGTED
jgi:hypothetical protein